MALKITLTPEDVLHGVLLTPGWHRLKIKRPSSQLSKKGDSTVFVFPFVVMSGPITKEKKPSAGVPVTGFYSDKDRGRGKLFLAKLLKSLGVTVDDKQAQSYDLEGCEGKETEGYIENQLDNNKVMQNTIVDFRPVSHPVPASSQ